MDCLNTREKWKRIASVRQSRAPRILPNPLCYKRSLAVSVGSTHGQKSRLDLELLNKIAESTRIPLVMHGGSGIHPDDIKVAASLNVYKVNIGAALIPGFVEGLEEAAALPSDHEPRHQQILRHVTAKLRDIARHRISLFGASGHGRKLVEQLAVAKDDLQDRVQRA